MAQQMTAARFDASSLTATPRRRQRAALAGPHAAPPRRQSTVCSAAALTGPGSVALVELGVQALAWTSVAFMGARVLMQQQQSQADEGPRRECDTCNGSGTVECWCSRWSDGDGGCSTCRGSGRMVCNSCRGGGNAVPIEARITIRNERSDNFRQGR